MDIYDLDKDEANELLSLEENHFRDLKAKEIAPAKLTRSISALANSTGGEVYIGISEQVKDNTKVRIWSGFTDLEAANSFIQTIESLAPLGNFYEAAFLRCAGYPGSVLKLNIQKTREIITTSDKAVYIRRGAQNLPVQGEDSLNRLRLDKGISSFEDETIPTPIDTITNSVTVLDFMINQVPSAEPETWLRSQFVVTNDKPTVAGTLLFSDSPQSALPKRSAVKIFQYRSREQGLDRDTLAFTPLTIEGPVYDLITKSIDETKAIIESIKKIGDQGLENISYPDETLHEIITNAVLHRDYSIPVDTQIRVYDDRVEVESPGKLPGHVTPDNVLNEQFARNPKIVRLINKFPNPPNKDVGEGLNTAFAAMRKIRLQDPILYERENALIVEIRHTRLSSPAQIIIEYLTDHATITNEKGREITGLRRDVQVKDVFVALRKAGSIEKVPGKRGRATMWQKISTADSM